MVLDSVEVELSEAQIDSLMELLDHTHNGWSVDRLVCHPQQATFFCEAARRKYGLSTASDFDLLWPMMNRRKKSAK